MPERPLKVAAVCTVFWPASHADVILSRWYTPRATDADWGWHGPRTELVSLYVDQVPENDLSAGVCRQHGIRRCRTLEEALTLGTGRLAVDAVFLIGEHGDYPRNSLGQKLYPRKEMFDAITAVFRQSGKAAPVYCDKHLSWNFQWAEQMVAAAEELGFALSAGSSIPLCRKEPAITPMSEFPAEEVVVLYYGPNEEHGYHSLEFAQSLIEHRPGGETGLAAVTAWKGGDAVAAAQRQGRWSAALVAEAVRVARPETQAPANGGQGGGEPAAFVLEYRDGLRVTHLNFSGKIHSWAAAMRHRRTGATQATTSIGGVREHHFPHFATLSRIIEDGWLGTPPAFPVQRTLLTTGIMARVMQALAEPGERIETPELGVRYQAGPYVHPADRPAPVGG